MMIACYGIRERPSAGNKNCTSWWGGLKDGEEEAKYLLKGKVLCQDRVRYRRPGDKPYDNMSGTKNHDRTRGNNKIIKLWPT